MLLLYETGRHGVVMKNEVEDYTEEKEYNHYNGVPSMYGKLVDEQCRQQPKYCMPGDAGKGMESDKRNEQAGP